MQTGNVPRQAPYLGVSHTGCGNERLLDGVALAEGRLLLCLWRLLLRPQTPVALDEELHHLHVAPQGRMDQAALAVLIQVVHLETERGFNRQQKKKHERIRTRGDGSTPSLSCGKAPSRWPCVPQQQHSPAA